MPKLLLLIVLAAFIVLVVALLRRWRQQTSSTTALPPPGQMGTSEPVDEDNLDDRLAELDRLLDEQQITENEYHGRREALLKSVKDRPPRR